MGNFEDINYLKEKYFEDKWTLNKLAKDVDTSPYLLKKKFKEYGLQIRHYPQNIRTPKNRSIKYPQLNNGEWLHEKYIKERLSTIQIAKIVGVKTENSVRQALIRNNIEVRSISDGLTINRDDGFVVNVPVIEGCLLGDGGLLAYNRKSDLSYPSFYKKNKNYDHVKYIESLLFPNSRETKTKHTLSKLNGNNYDVFYLKSYAKKDLLSLYRKWYPLENNYKKIIPEDVDVSPEALLHWFMDDGCSTLRKGLDRKSKQVFITMCSESFTKDEQQMLSEKIYGQYGLTMNVRKSNSGGTGWRIIIPQSQTCLFYEIIGPCPVPSLEYKWK